MNVTVGEQSIHLFIINLMTSFNVICVYQSLLIKIQFFLKQMIDVEYFCEIDVTFIIHTYDMMDNAKFCKKM